jgi:hypothetical protein
MTKKYVEKNGIWQREKYCYTTSMILFINPIPENINLTLFKSWNIRDTITIIKGDDFSTFPEKVVELVDLYSIDEIWCICGPGAFTRMRIVTLTLNTLSLTKSIKLKSCHFFDIIDDSSFPTIKANDREYIIKVDHTIKLCEKTHIPPWEYIWYGDQNDFTEDKVLIQYSEKYDYISQVFEKIVPSSGLVPIYLKDPHITWSKKNTSHS